MLKKAAKRYGEITRAAKRVFRKATDGAKSGSFTEEARLFHKFQRRAKDDFRSLSTGVGHRR
jgi:hypothetical protein